MMRHTSRLLCAALAAAVLEVAAAATAADPASLAEDAMNERGDSREFMAAGTSVVPYLLAGLDSPDAQRRKNASLLLGGMFSMNPYAMNELRSSPERIPELVAALSPRLGDPGAEVRRNLGYALLGVILQANQETFDVDVLPILSGYLASADPAVRAGTAGVLGLVAQHRRIPMALLVPALIDPSAEVQERAAGAIREQVKFLQQARQECEGCDVAAAVLKQLLGQRERAVAYSAATALGRIAPEDDDAIAVLVEVVGAEFAGRYSPGHALSVLQWMEQQRSRSMVPLLEALLQSPDANLRRGAEIALKTLRGG